MKKIDMARIKKIHFVGIGGCGMSAIAKILRQLGYKVAGSDLKESANTIRLRDLGVEVHIGHDASNVRRADLVIFSTAIPKENTELKEAKAQGIPIQPRAQMLSWIMQQSEVAIAVAGTHGKTTTTSMVSAILEHGGLNPTFLIGGEANDVDGNARLGNGKFVVAEADESDGSFLRLQPKIGIITNIEDDHLDYYGNLENVINAFFDFTKTLPKDGLLVINLDSENNKTLLEKMGKEKKCITYGFDEKADLHVAPPKFKEGTAEFEVSYKGKKLGHLRLGIPGEQNVSNSLAALAVGMELGIDFGQISVALQSFRGARRRFQKIGAVGDIIIFDDYAHHPTEVRVTLQATRNGWPQKRIIAIFQPHRFTRTMFLAKEFGRAFTQADVIVLTDVYAAGENPIPGVSGQSILGEMMRNKEQEVTYIQKKEKIADYLSKIAKDGDIVLTMGAGDIHTVGKELYNRLKSK